jgi:hypothetical protein
LVAEDGYQGVNGNVIFGDWARSRTTKARHPREGGDPVRRGLRE